MMNVTASRDSVIVVVDDDPSVCEGLWDLFASMGFAAETFHRAGDFLGSPLLRRASCLIADVQMPEMSGFELYDHLIGRGIHIPTILLTAFPKDADRARAVRTGIRCYLSKPFSEGELLSCIRSTLPGGDSMGDG
jgi:FixJ family two-component response regulator